MSRNVVLDTPTTNGLRKALLFVSDDGREWGWWCPECTQGKGRLVSQGEFATRDGARRAGKQHEQRWEHNR